MRLCRISDRLVINLDHVVAVSRSDAGTPTDRVGVTTVTGMVTVVDDPKAAAKLWDALCQDGDDDGAFLDLTAADDAAKPKAPPKAKP